MMSLGMAAPVRVRVVRKTAREKDDQVPNDRCVGKTQILYHNSATRSSFAVMIDNETLLQCWTSVDAVTANTTAADNARYKTCYTAGVTRLHGNQQVWINDLYGNHIFTNTNSSFFGVVKLSL